MALSVGVDVSSTGTGDPMTLVVALESEGGIHMGTDSFIGDTMQKDTLDQPKWFTSSGVTFGYAGDISVIQIVKYDLKFRARKRNENPEEYLSRYAFAIRRRLSMHDIGSKDGAFFIAALDDRIFTIQEDLSVFRSAHGYAAIGVGSLVALGSLASTLGLPPRERLEKALTAATQHSFGVSPPFHFMTR